MPKGLIMTKDPEWRDSIIIFLHTKSEQILTRLEDKASQI